MVRIEGLKLPTVVTSPEAVIVGANKRFWRLLGLDPQQTGMELQRFVKTDQHELLERFLEETRQAEEGASQTFTLAAASGERLPVVLESMIDRGDGSPHAIQYI